MIRTPGRITNLVAPVDVRIVDFPRFGRQGGEPGREIGRVLRPGGRLVISDIVLDGELPDAVRNDVLAYVGCVAGAEQRERYFQMLEEAEPAFRAYAQPQAEDNGDTSFMIAELLLIARKTF